MFWLLGGNWQDDKIGQKVGINVGVSCENSLERRVDMESWGSQSLDLIQRR